MNEISSEHGERKHTQRFIADRPLDVHSIFIKFSEIDDQIPQFDLKLAC